MDAQSFERHIWTILRSEGKKWKYYERATSGETHRITALALAVLKSQQTLAVEPIPEFSTPLLPRLPDYPEFLVRN